MNFNITDKTKKGLMIGGAAAVLFLGGFGGGFAFGKNQDNAGRDRFDRKEVMRDDSFGGFDSDMDDDFFFNGDEEDFGMNRKGQRRGRSFGDFEDFEDFDFDFDDEDFESGRDSSRSERRSRMMDEDSRSGATEDDAAAKEKSSKDKTSEDAAKDNTKDSSSKDKTSDSKTDKENVQSDILIRLTAGFVFLTSKPFL